MVLAQFEQLGLRRLGQVEQLTQLHAQRLGFGAGVLALGGQTLAARLQLHLALVHRRELRLELALLLALAGKLGFGGLGLGPGPREDHAQVGGLGARLLEALERGLGVGLELRLALAGGIDRGQRAALALRALDELRLEPRTLRLKLGPALTERALARLELMLELRDLVAKRARPLLRVLVRTLARVEQ